MQKIQLRDKTFAQITYYKLGRGPAILLVHGFPANVHLWRHQIEALSENYTLLLPNFFEEERDWLDELDQTSMHLLAQSFNDILEYEQIKKVLFIGHSMGGYMGLAFAEIFPEKIVGLSLVHSSPLPDDDARAEGRRKTVAILEAGGKNLFLKKMVPALFPPSFLSEKPDVVNRQLTEALAVDNRSLIAFYKAIMNRKSTIHVTANAHFPVQMIVGIKDSLANINKELAGSNLSFINFVSIYQNQGHMAMLENPERVKKDLLSFAQFCWNN